MQCHVRVRHVLLGSEEARVQKQLDSPFTCPLLAASIRVNPAHESMRSKQIQSDFESESSCHRHVIEIESKGDRSANVGHRNDVEVRAK